MAARRTNAKIAWWVIFLVMIVMTLRILWLENALRAVTENQDARFWQMSNDVSRLQHENYLLQQEIDAQGKLFGRAGG